AARAEYPAAEVVPSSVVRVGPARSHGRNALAGVCGRRRDRSRCHARRSRTQGEGLGRPERGSVMDDGAVDIGKLTDIGADLSRGLRVSRAKGESTLEYARRLLSIVRSQRRKMDGHELTLLDWLAAHRR